MLFGLMSAPIVRLPGRRMCWCLSTLPDEHPRSSVVIGASASLPRWRRDQVVVVQGVTKARGPISDMVFVAVPFAVAGKRDARRVGRYLMPYFVVAKRRHVAVLNDRSRRVIPRGSDCPHRVRTPGKQLGNRREGFRNVVGRYIRRNE